MGARIMGLGPVKLSRLRSGFEQKHPEVLCMLHVIDGGSLQPIVVLMLSENFIVQDHNLKLPTEPHTSAYISRGCMY